MKHSFNNWSLSLFAAGILAVSVYAGCASDSNDNEGTKTGGSGGSGGSHATGGNGGTGGQNQAGQSQGGQNQGGQAQGGQGQGGQAGNTCAKGEPSTVEKVATGVSADKVQVDIKGAIAETGRIFVSRSKKTDKDGNVYYSCLWGAFVRDPDKPFGTMIISYGDKAGADGNCPTTGSLIPEDLKPGDKLDLVGAVTSYKSKKCTDAPAQKQIKVCSVTKTGSGQAPDPVLVADPADLTKGDAKYQGLLVKIENVDAENWPKNDAGKGGTVGPYGIIKLQGSGLEIHDNFYYKNKTNGGAPVYDDSQHFKSIVGISALDNYSCKWVLQPRDKCTDLDPPSKDCVD